MNSICQQQDIYNRRAFISRYIPRNLIELGEESNRSIMGARYDHDFIRITNFMANDTCISLDCAELLMCVHILAAAWGRCIVQDGEQREAPVIHAFGIANSGQRKSAVNDKLCAPALAYEAKLKGVNSAENGPISREMIKSLPRSHVKKFIAEIDFANPASLLEAVDKSKQWDSFYIDLNRRVKATPNINVTDVTPHQLAKIMQENGEAQLMASPEPGGLEKFLLHSNMDLALKAYGQEPYSYHSARAQIELRKPALNIAVFGQPRLALKIYSSSRLLNRGSLARIMPYINPPCQPKS